jgi:hypothetical protein
MISIKRNGKSVAVYPSSKLSFEFNNPLFDEEFIRGEYVIPFDCPYPGNAEFFEMIHQLLLQQRKKSFEEATVRFKGSDIAPAILDVQEVNDEVIKLSMRLNFSALQCISKKLREFNYETVDLGSDIIASATAIAGLGYPNTNFNFPVILNEGFYGDKNPDFEFYMNQFNSDSGVYEDNSVTNKTTLVPMVYLHHIIERGFAFDNYTVDYSGFMADTRMKKIMLYFNRCIDKIESGPATNGMQANLSHIVDVGNGDILNLECDNENYDALNCYDPSSGEYEITAIGSYNLKTIFDIQFKGNSNPAAQDKIIMRYYLDGVQIYYEEKDYYGAGNITQYLIHNYTATAGDVGKKITVEIDYFNSYTPLAYMRLGTSTSFSVNDFYFISNVNVFNAVFNLSDHVPDVTFGELLNAIRKTFRLQFNYDHVNKTVQIIYFDQNIKKGSKDLHKQRISGHTIRMDESGLIKLFNFNFGSDNKLTDENFKPYAPERYLGSFDSLLQLNAAIPPIASTRDRYVLVRNLNQILVCKETTTPGIFEWAFYSDAFYDEIINVNGTVEVKPDWSPLLMRVRFDYKNNATVLLPAINQLGSGNEFGLGENECGLHFLFYHGILDVCSSQWMPTASTTNIDLLGNAIVGTTFGFTWKPADLRQFQEGFLLMTQSGELFIKKIALTLPMFQSFNIVDPIRFDGGDFLIKSMKVSAADEIDLAEYICYKII